MKYQHAMFRWHFAATYLVAQTRSRQSRDKAELLGTTRKLLPGLAALRVTIASFAVLPKKQDGTPPSSHLQAQLSGDR